MSRGSGFRRRLASHGLRSEENPPGTGPYATLRFTSLSVRALPPFRREPGRVLRSLTRSVLGYALSLARFAHSARCAAYGECRE